MVEQGAGELSRLDLGLIAWAVRDGKAEPDQAKRLMVLFRDRVRDGEPLPQELLRHFADAFDAYLSGSRTLDAALGVSRSGRGRPALAEQEGIRRAAEVIRERLAGSSHQDALTAVSSRLHKSESVIGESFAAHRLNGLILLRCERPAGPCPWTPREVSTLIEMFSDQPWFVAPEKSP
jgi:hypothetical protein